MTIRRSRGYTPRLAVKREFEYDSSSSPGKVYTTILWADDTLSCNCPGWTRRVAADGTRDCKHCRQAEDTVRRERVMRVPVYAPQPTRRQTQTTEQPPEGRRRVFFTEE